MLGNFAERYFALMEGKCKDTLIDLGALSLRIGGLFMALGHGYGKLTGFDQYKTQFIDFLGIGTTASLVLAIFGEFICGILVALGLTTRLAAIPLMTTMMVAAFVAHAKDPFFSTGGASKEFALVYLIIFTGVFFIGGGRFSLDHLIAKMLRRK